MKSLLQMNLSMWPQILLTEIQPPFVVVTADSHCNCSEWSCSSGGLCPILYNRTATYISNLHYKGLCQSWNDWRSEAWWESETPPLKRQDKHNHFICIGFALALLESRNEIYFRLNRHRIGLHSYLTEYYLTMGLVILTEKLQLIQQN